MKLVAFQRTGYPDMIINADMIVHLEDHGGDTTRISFVFATGGNQNPYFVHVSHRLMERWA